MDPCFYRRRCITGTDPNDSMSDAIIILHMDDMRVAAAPDALEILHDLLYTEFQITTSDTGLFLGMDTVYDLQAGIFKMHMATYIDTTLQRFENFDLSKGIPYRELVGSLLWIVRESQSGSRAQVAAMLPVCTMYDHLDRYKA